MVSENEKLVFGDIENIEVGQVFENREALSKARIHGPTMAGIWGRESEGACSIVLSGGYEDDIDELDYIFYTGQGGQDIPGALNNLGSVLPSSSVFTQPDGEGPAAMPFHADRR